jgi:hypothetical protein
VQIVIDIHLDQDGRPTGTVRAADKAEVHPFSGNLEFLGLIERLYQSDSDPIVGPDQEEKS